MEHPREKWNRRWKERAGEPGEPDPWLLRALPLLPKPGSALDIACGGGRNALFLAGRGWRVTAVDVAEEGLSLIASESVRSALSVTTLWTDLEADPVLPRGPFDLVLLFFYMQRSLFPALRAAVAPGGLVVVRTFSTAGGFPGGPNPDFSLHPGELPEIFADWEIILHEEGEESARRGGGLAGIIVRRPRLRRGFGGQALDSKT